jgi:hypothetical protein
VDTAEPASNANAANNVRDFTPPGTTPVFSGPLTAGPANSLMSISCCTRDVEQVDTPDLPTSNPYQSPHTVGRGGGCAAGSHPAESTGHRCAYRTYTGR